MSIVTLLNGQPVANGNATAPGATIVGKERWVAQVGGVTPASVEFRVDAPDTQPPAWVEHYAPFQYKGDPDGVLDTTQLADGTHKLSVRVLDRAGAPIGSVATYVAVANAPVPPPVPVPPPPAGTLPRYGTCNGWRYPFRSAADQAFEIQQELQLGAKIMRTEIDNDNGLARLLSAGLQMWMLQGGNPSYPWSQTPTQFASTVHNRVAHWRTTYPAVRIYECLNEPNIHGWTPDAYVPYLRAFYDAVLKANPDAIVGMAGLWSGSGSQALVPWMERFIALGGLNYTRYVNVHLYDDPAEHGNWSLWDMTFGSGGRGYYDQKNVRSMCDAWAATNNKPKLPIVSTESGGPYPKYSLEKQATIVRNALGCVDGQGLGYRKLATCLIYNVLDDDVAGFGLLDPQRKPRPAFGAYREVVAAAA